MIKIISKKKIWLTLSSIFVATSLVFLIVWGLNFGIDFTGGSLMEVKFSDNVPEQVLIKEKLNNLDIGDLLVQSSGDNNLLFRFQEIDEDKHQKILEILKNLDKEVNEKYLMLHETGINQDISKSTSTIVSTSSGTKTELKSDYSLFQELRFDSIGPSIGSELKRKSIYNVIIVLLAIVFYVAWAFRKVSESISSWKYGVCALIALFHDCLFVLGVFSFLGKFYNMEINSAFIAAILTVLGYSVNDTIVIFDRIRENLLKTSGEFSDIVNKSLNQTLSRSINTSLTTMLVLGSIFIFGGDSIKDFVLALLIGVGIGTYSSIFLAAPILVFWEEMSSNKK